MGSNIGMYPDMDNPTEYFGINHVFVNVRIMNTQTYWSIEPFQLSVFENIDAARSR